MTCPFPGMDPYIEQPAIWPDFHDSLITAIRGALNPFLRPRYAALTQDRLYVFQSSRPIYPDIGVIDLSPRRRTTAHGAATLEADAPAVFELGPDEIRIPYIEIIEPAAGNRIVTTIEVLSPTNKDTGLGRDHYVQKRRELWSAGVNLVEIDLLRAGEKTVWDPQAHLDSLRPWHYVVAVARRSELTQELYAISLRRRLPTISIPLANDDKDVPLDLQAAFIRCWNEGPYPELLHYHEAPPAILSDDDVAWCKSLVQQPPQ
jgi:hypothetical protein